MSAVIEIAVYTCRDGHRQLHSGECHLCRDRGQRCATEGSFVPAAQARDALRRTCDSCRSAWLRLAPRRDWPALLGPRHPLAALLVLDEQAWIEHGIEVWQAAGIDLAGPEAPSDAWSAYVGDADIDTGSHETPRAALRALATFIETQVDDLLGTHAHLVGTCCVCGCTEDDCSGCVERTGRPCAWAEPDLCTACAAEDAA